MIVTEAENHCLNGIIQKKKSASLGWFQIELATLTMLNSKLNARKNENNENYSGLELRKIGVVIQLIFRWGVPCLK